MREMIVPSFLQALTMTIILGVVFHMSPEVTGQVMSSSNFSLQSDSVNFGGGDSTSGNYSLESTMGEIATGDAVSASFSLRAGYQQMQEIYIALSVPSVVPLSPALFGLTGGTSTGAVGANVVTDNRAGYTLSIQAVGTPAMQTATSSIADYAPVGLVPDYDFLLAPTAAVFGFTVEGDDIAVRYQDSGGVCGVSGGDTLSRCWDGLSTTTRIIAQGNTDNHPTGATTTLRFQVGLGGMIAVPPGQYVATSTLTALPQ